MKKLENIENQKTKEAQELYDKIFKNTIVDFKYLESLNKNNNAEQKCEQLLWTRLSHNSSMSNIIE